MGNLFFFYLFIYLPNNEGTRINSSVLLIQRNIDYREFLEMVRDPDAKLEELAEEDETQDASNKPLGLEWGVIVPKGEEELKALKEKQQAEEKRLEEEEIAKEKEFEQKIRREIIEEEEIADRTQEGGPNPKLLGEGCIKYDFTTGKQNNTHSQHINADLLIDCFVLQQEGDPVTSLAVGISRTSRCLRRNT